MALGSPANANVLTYTVTGLSDYTTTATDFTVTPSDPAAVCGMSYGLVRRSAAPWTFTVDPLADAADDFVSVSLCSGGTDSARIPTRIPWRVDTLQVSHEWVDAAGHAQVEVFSYLGEDTTASLRDATGSVVGSVTVPRGLSAVVQVPARSTAVVRRYVMQLDDPARALRMEVPIVVSNKWSTLNNGRPTFPRCSTVTWFYDGTGAPRGLSTRKLHADIVGALQRLSTKTGLHFTEVASIGQLPATNSLVIDWKFRVSDYPKRTAAHGGYLQRGATVTGAVNLNATNWWTRGNKYAGFRVATGRHKIAGRGWLVVHEVMHALGVAHTSDPRQVMAPTMGRLSKFGAGDVAALDFLYRPATCTG